MAQPVKEYFLVERMWCLTCGGCGSVAGVSFGEPRDPNPRAKCPGCNGNQYFEYYTKINKEEWDKAWDAIEATEVKKQIESEG